MSSTRSTTAAGLSFDVLGLIFSHYVDTETIVHPLETLLLVCKSWHEAALGHRALWKQLTIHIGHSPSSAIWKRRLPLRLERSGTSLPLHIDLRNMLLVALPNRNDPEYQSFTIPMYRRWGCTDRVEGMPYNHCTCVEEGFLCIDELLLLLAGSGGELCKRWKTLHFESPPNLTNYSLHYKQLHTVLANPMPILESLTIHGLFISEWKKLSLSFPHTPVLKALALDRDSPLRPSLQSVRSLTVTNPRPKIFSSIADRSTLAEAGNVEELTINGKYILPKAMPNLWKLEVKGAIHWPDKEVSYLPSLTHISLETYHCDWLVGFVQSPNVDLTLLISFGLQWNANIVSFKERDILPKLFQGAKNLAFLHGDPTVVAIMLKLIWETTKESGPRKAKKKVPGERLLAGQRIEIKITPNGPTAIVRGDESRYQLCMVAEKLGIKLPDSPWGNMFCPEEEEED